jgi:hypothetical protein
MTKKSKVELYLVETDENGVKTYHKVKTKSLGDLETAKWWIKRAVDHQEWDDDQPYQIAGW